MNIKNKQNKLINFKILFKKMQGTQRIRLLTLIASSNGNPSRSILSITVAFKHVKNNKNYLIDPMAPIKING